jgi:type III pantothenate kinase
MNILIGDIGNSVIKVCLVDADKFKLKKIFYLKSKEILSIKSLKKFLNNVFRKKKIHKTALFSSVVPNYQKILKKILYNLYGITLKEIKNKSINKIIKINIKNKNQIGSDRIANAVGVYKKYSTNCIVVDFGTATTFDIITKHGIYNGGIIAPGVKVSIKSLITAADQIPNFSLKKQKKVVGKNTVEALRSGFYWGYVGLINNIISKIEKETQKKHKIIFTGGYAKLFKTSIIKNFKVDKNITIDGIIEIYKKNTNYLN